MQVQPPPIDEDFNESAVSCFFIQEKMPFCLSLFTGLFFIATPTFIGLSHADFAALDLNHYLTNGQLFIAELSVCIAFAILIGIALYQFPNKRYSDSIKNYIKLSDDNNMNKLTVGVACLYFAGTGIFFSTLNTYFLPRFAKALSTNIWSWKTIGLLTIIGSGLLRFPILLQHVIKGTRNKVIVAFLAYLLIASSIALHVLPNISLIKSEKIITIMHQINFYTTTTCGVALLFLIITFLTLNYHTKSLFSTIHVNFSYRTDSSNDSTESKQKTNITDPVPLL